MISQSVHVQIDNFDIFRDVISLLARVFIFLIDRATQEVPMINIWNTLLVQFLRYTLSSMSTEEAWRHLRTLHFYPEYIDLPGVCMQQFVMIHWKLQ